MSHDIEYRQRQADSAKAPKRPELDFANREYTVRVNIDGMLLRLDEVWAESEDDAKCRARAWARKHFPNLDEDHLYATAEFA